MKWNIYFGQILAIGTSDLYNPKVSDNATITAAVKAGLIRRRGGVGWSGKAGA